MTAIRRGDVRLASLKPRGGDQQPVLVMQSQDLTESGHPSIVVPPLTDKLVDDAEPLRIRVRASGKLKESDVVVDQIRTIAADRLASEPLARLSSSTITRIERALREVLDLYVP